MVPLLSIRHDFIPNLNSVTSSASHNLHCSNKLVRYFYVYESYHSTWLTSHEHRIFSKQRQHTEQSKISRLSTVSRERKYLTVKMHITNATQLPYTTAHLYQDASTSNNRQQTLNQCAHNTGYS